MASMYYAKDTEVKWTNRKVQIKETNSEGGIENLNTWGKKETFFT